MADLYQKALESERRSLWAECRLKGLGQGTPERLRIVECATTNSIAGRRQLRWPDFRVRTGSDSCLLRV